MRCTLLFTFLLIIFAQEQEASLVTDTKYTLEDAVDDIAFFIPGAKVILVTGIKLWHLYGELNQIIRPNSTEIEKSLKIMEKDLSTISNRMDDINDQLYTLSIKIKKISDLINDQVINGLPKEFGLDNKMIAIYSNMNKIKSLFKKFLVYTEKPFKFQNDTLLNFANNVVDHSFNELPSTLEQIHDTLTEDSSGVNILEILANPKLSRAMMCKRRESSQYYINNLYNSIMKVEIKGILMTQYAYWLKGQLQNVSYTTELEEAKRELYKRTLKSCLELKKTMLFAPRDVWSCDPPLHEKGRTYIQLDPIFQAYVTHEIDSTFAENKKNYFSNNCKGTCSDRNNFADSCKSDYCKKHSRPCTGYLRDCKSHDSKMKICLEDKQNSRRFKHVELLKKNEVFGKNNSCDESNEITVKNYMHWFRECEYCFCTCESLDTDILRYFSLKDVMADVHENKVITGVRFTEENNVIHIQIEQGQLLKNGNVNESTVEWKASNNDIVNNKDIELSEDYHSITWDERTVLLDDLDSPPGNILTGLRFKLINGALRLEVHSTPFDFESGELFVKNSKWRFNSKSIDERSELKIDDLNLPTTSYSNFPDSNNGEYFQFTISSLKEDIGQTVVPFIDIQPIVSSHPVPLSGAALIHRGSPDTAGFLAFKLYTYNFAPHLVV